MCGMWNVRDVGCAGCGMLGMWYVGDVVCWGCGMLGMWDVWDVGVWDVGCSGCGMFGMWDVGCGMFAGMLDVDLQNAPIFHQNSISVRAMIVEERIHKCHES